VLSRHSLTAADAYSYRLWVDPVPPHFPLDGPQGAGPTPHPTGRPDGYRPTFVPSTLVTVANGPISTNDPWLPAGANVTNGNNVKAYADLKAPNGFGGADVLGTASGPGAFDRTYDPLQNPDVSAEQRMAAATQLFYDINFLHDWYYDRGFDERSGNAQTSNLGRGGIENDPINAEGQDNSGRSNANMSTPADGSRPRMQMYIFTGTSTERLTYNGANVTANGAAFGPQTFNVTAEVVYVNDGDPSGMGGTVNDGCQATFVAPVMGKIALVDRGNCTFVQKVQIAQMNGAVGVIIADNSTMSTRPPELVGTPMPQTLIPAMSLTRTAGTTLKAAIGTTALNVTLFRNATTDRDGTLDNGNHRARVGPLHLEPLIGDGNGLSAASSRGHGRGLERLHALLMMVRADDIARAVERELERAPGHRRLHDFAATTPRPLLRRAAHALHGRLHEERR
jgi:hypothetical protein